MALLGVVLGLALLSLVAVSVVWSGTRELQMAAYHRDAVQALHVAEAGLERAISLLETRPGWRETITNDYRGPGGQPRINDPFDFGTHLGAYRVTFSQPAPDTVLVRSAGTVARAARAVQGLVGLEPPEAVRYVLFSDVSLYVAGDAASLTGDVFVNGDLTNRARVEVDGSVYLTGRLVNVGKRARVEASGGVFEGVAPVTRPLPPLGWYEALATTVLDGDRELVDPVLADEVLVVRGDLTIRGTYGGRGTIVVTGQVVVSRDLLRGDPADGLALIGLQDLVVAPGRRVEALLYVYGEAHLGARVSLDGALVAAAAYWPTRLEATHAVPPPAALPPGLPGLRAVLLEWQEVPP